MIQDLINDLFLTDGETKRINCPSCGGYKTFTITSKDGLVVWNCYKASCNAKGATPVSMSRDALITRINAVGSTFTLLFLLPRKDGQIYG